MVTVQNRTDKIIAYESGELDAVEIVELFSHLVETGLAWSLQGRYGRAAQGMIEAGVLSESGEINHKRLSKLIDGG